MIYRIQNLKSQQIIGFTIVELLVVIVVVGILAAISLVSYAGISKQATVASLQSDLTNMSKQIMIFKVDNGMYPATISVDCITKPTTKTNLCIKTSSDISYIDYQVDNPSNPQSYTLTKTDSNIRYSITDDRAPVLAAMYWKQVAAGTYHTCAIASDNQAYCWGYNAQGQLGNNSTTNSLIPTAVTTSGVLNGKTIKSIASGEYHTCVIASDDKVYCWGWNDYGGLGDNTATTRYTPVAVSTAGVLNGKMVKSITISGYHTCAIASDDKAYCWGYNNYGQLGDGSNTNRYAPVAVSTAGVLSGKTVKSVAAGKMFHTCAIASDDLVYCWGYNYYGQIGDNSINNSAVPVAVSTAGVLNGKTIKSISSGGHQYTCAIASDNQAYCWGFNDYGRIGDNTTSTRYVPAAVSTAGVLNGKTVKSIATGGYHTCAIASDDKAYCWGYGTYGQLGNNSAALASYIPVAVSTAGSLNGKTVKSITNGNFHTCAIASDNQIYCWGSNNTYGMLGNNSTTQSLVPVSVIPLGS